jgi:hypothetical protein
MVERREERGWPPIAAAHAIMLVVISRISFLGGSSRRAGCRIRRAFLYRAACQASSPSGGLFAFLALAFLRRPIVDDATTVGGLERDGRKDAPRRRRVPDAPSAKSTPSTPPRGLRAKSSNWPEISEGNLGRSNAQSSSFRS